MQPIAQALPQNHCHVKQPHTSTLRKTIHKIILVALSLLALSTDPLAFLVGVTGGGAYGVYKGIRQQHNHPLGYGCSEGLLRQLSDVNPPEEVTFAGAVFSHAFHILHSAPHGACHHTQQVATGFFGTIKQGLSPVVAPIKTVIENFNIFSALTGVSVGMWLGESAVVSARWIKNRRTQ